MAFPRGWCPLCDDDDLMCGAVHRDVRLAAQRARTALVLYWLDTTPDVPVSQYERMDGPARMSAGNRWWRFGVANLPAIR